MKIVKIEREIQHKLNVAKFETIVPSLRMEAILDDGESYEEGLKELNAVLEKEWNKLALIELRAVNKRRSGTVRDDDVLPALMNHFKSNV